MMTSFGTLKVIAGLISIVNPLGAIPVFVSLTAPEDHQARRHIARTTAIATSIVLWIATFFGDDRYCHFWLFRYHHSGQAEGFSLLED